MYLPGPAMQPWTSMQGRGGRADGVRDSCRVWIPNRYCGPRADLFGLPGTLVSKPGSDYLLCLWTRSLRTFYGLSWRYGLYDFIPDVFEGPFTDLTMVVLRT